MARLSCREARRRMQSCLDLDAPPQAELAGHLSACRACAAWLGRLLEFRTGLRAELEAVGRGGAPAVTVGPVRRFRFVPAAAAALLAVALAGGALLSLVPAPAADESRLELARFVGELIDAPFFQVAAVDPAADEASGFSSEDAASFSFEP